MIPNLDLKFKILRKYPSQAEFAQELGINESKVSRVIRGRSTLAPDERKKWAQLLGVETRKLFSDD